MLLRNAATKKEFIPTASVEQKQGTNVSKRDKSKSPKLSSIFLEIHKPCKQMKRAYQFFFLFLFFHIRFPNMWSCFSKS